MIKAGFDVHLIKDTGGEGSKPNARAPPFLPCFPPAAPGHPWPANINVARNEKLVTRRHCEGGKATKSLTVKVRVIYSSSTALEVRRIKDYLRAL